MYYLDANEYFDCITNKLCEDMHYLLKEKPKYIFGKLPFDKPIKKYYL